MSKRRGDEGTAVSETQIARLRRDALPRKPAANEPITIERLERGLLILAYLIVRCGERVYASLYEKLELELAELQRKEATIERAKLRLEQNPDRLAGIGLGKRK